MSNLITIRRPFIIAGPCSAETEEQVLETALRLKAGGKIDLLRAGIWKPRTRPNSFEGLGDDVTYTVNSDGNIRTVEMTFSSAVEKPYVYKMLLVLGCQEVVIAGQSMTINDFLAMLNE
jgi:3-deoxy-D-arabino-heptulosonate 7-phosphate (DAHP) synthase